MEKSQDYFLKISNLEQNQAMFKSPQRTQFNPKHIYNLTLNQITNGTNKE